MVAVCCPVGFGSDKELVKTETLPQARGCVNTRNIETLFSVIRGFLTTCERCLSHVGISEGVGGGGGLRFQVLVVLGGGGCVGLSCALCGGH